MRARNIRVTCVSGWICTGLITLLPDGGLSCSKGLDGDKTLLFSLSAPTGVLTGEAIVVFISENMLRIFSGTGDSWHIDTSQLYSVDRRASYRWSILSAMASHSSRPRDGSGPGCVRSIRSWWSRKWCEHTRPEAQSQMRVLGAVTHPDCSPDAPAPTGTEAPS